MQGGCLCGAVRFQVTGSLTEIELCHCDRCKRAYGAALEIPVSLLGAAPEGPAAYHQYVGQRAPWHEILDALPQYDEGAPLERKVLREIL